LAEIAGPEPVNLPAHAFLHGLRDLGWIDGRTIIIERCSVDGRPVLFGNVSRIIAFAAERRLAAVYPWREATEAGGLMSYGSSAQGLFRQAAGYVDRILKGAKPGELPIEQPAKFALMINLKVAKTLGVDVPVTLLARAEELPGITRTLQGRPRWQGLPAGR
jgi:hypothetical protein